MKWKSKMYIKRLSALFTGSLFCMACVGCVHLNLNMTKDREGVISGSVTDYTDHFASKEIESKNIVSYHAHFYANGIYEDSPTSGVYDFKIEDNESGEHVLMTSGVYEHELTVDDQVFVDLQEIIAQYDLVKNNGAGKVTAGLPIEFEPWILDVMYDSGEQLYFHESGIPAAEWPEAFRNYFVGILIEAGYEDVITTEEMAEKYVTDLEIE